MTRKDIEVGDLVNAVSGNEEVQGFVQKVEWDHDQWSYLVGGSWFCQSEVVKIENPQRKEEKFSPEESKS
jgi:hypothetical protein